MAYSHQLYVPICHLLFSRSVPRILSFVCHGRCLTDDDSAERFPRGVLVPAISSCPPAFVSRVGRSVWSETRYEIRFTRDVSCPCYTPYAISSCVSTKAVGPSRSNTRIPQAKFRIPEGSIFPFSFLIFHLRSCRTCPLKEIPVSCCPPHIYSSHLMKGLSAHA